MYNNYISSKQACKLLHISPMTLMRYKNSNKINWKQISDKKILYDVSPILQDTKPDRKHVVYARVSTTKQKDDLSRQIQVIQEYISIKGHIVDGVYQDIASGMNENRKHFNELMSEVISGNIDTVYISYKDRLVRFGFNYFVNLFEKYNTKIVILNSTKEEDFQSELTQDLISIIHHFSMKMHSNRRKTLKELVKNMERNEE